jgi:LPXTG-site transpeptidase (sortase) family protein
MTQAKKIFKAAVLIYLASFFIINWNDVSWIFNYREVSGLVSDFFNPYPSIDASTIQDAYLGKNQPTVTKQLIQNTAINFTDKQNTLEIPKISISVPIIFANSTNISVLEKNLDQGVVYYPGSVLPGQAGQAIILGHSAPPGWPKTKHDWVFTDLEKLTVGDLILVDLNNKQYTYIVKQKTIIARGADIPEDSASATNNVLTLISCWPPGKDYQRIAVQAELLVN